MADAVADGTLGREELMRLADEVYKVDDTGRYKKVFEKLEANSTDGKAAAGMDKSELNLALKAGAFEEAEVTKEQYRAACRAAPVLTLSTGHEDNPFYNQRMFTGKFVEAWFAKLGLPLVPREASCLDIFCA
eukprot:COSAG04_NODE_2115_length_4761_cov_2.518662_6_plen_132_part_00